MRTISPMPSLSPRSPYSTRSPQQMYSKSPQLFKRCTDIQTKSPKAYGTRSPYYCNKQIETDDTSSNNRWFDIDS